MTHSPVRTHRGRLAWYGLAVFLSSAFLLVLEIVAGRLIAPYVGVSLYTWTSIIGVILAGLSLGNWLGGVWADRGADERAVGLTLGLAGVFSLGILLMLTLVAPIIEAGRLNLLSASFLYVLALFFVPAVLLGVVTPLLTTIALRLDSRSGHVVGRMHALAALGSILGTFVTGYWLIQYFGTHTVIIGTAAGLFILAIPFLRSATRTVPVVLVAGIVLVSAATYARQGFTNPCDLESSYFCIRVVDHSETAPFGQARALVLDHLIHGTNHATEPAMLIAPYVHLMDEVAVQHFGPERSATLDYFFAGGGAYTLPRGIKAMRPDAGITVAELDPLVTRTAEEKVYLSTEGMRVVHGDARMALQRLDERFDVIYGDAFHDISIPYHLVTREYAALVKSRLREDGMYVLNVLDAFPDPKLVKAMVKTLRQEFSQVDIWLETLPPQPTRMTFVITASDHYQAPEFLRASRGFQRMWYRVTEPLAVTGTSYDALPLLTDSYVPVERLVSSFFFEDLGR